MSATETYPKNIGTERFVLSVDRQEKRSYADQAMALEDADRLRKSFPKILIEVRDTQDGAIQGAKPD